MTEQTPDSKVDNETESDPGKWAFVGFIAGVIVTVFALQYYGYVVFPNKEDRAIVEEFKLLSLAPEYDVKVSPKASGKEAFCQAGYLLLRPQNGKELAGILVDEKNRGIECHGPVGTDIPEE
jgi:hypothetical protein